MGQEILGDLPEASLWMTPESKLSITKYGGNCKGTVPVHYKRSYVSTIPLYTEEQMLSERKRCFDLGRSQPPIDQQEA